MTNERIIEKTVAATQEVFQMMLGVDAAPGEARVAHGALTPTQGILSFIGLAGTWAGTGSIACSAAFACRLSELLLMSEYPAVNEEVLDAVAEVTNMIIGNVKTGLEEDLGPMGLSIPTVIFGRNFSSRTAGNNDWVVIPFAVEGHELTVQICLAPQRDQQMGQKLVAAGYPIPL